MNLITPEEKTRLEAQLRDCIDFRKVITTRIEEARALGDLRENAEYHAAREDQGMNEAKIRDIERKLKTAIVADGTAAAHGDVVFLGATVRVRDVATGGEETYRLVGEIGSAAPDDEVVAVTPSSPLGEALMKARVGETVKVDLRRGPRRFEIVAIS